VSDTPSVPASAELPWLLARVAELETQNAQLHETGAARLAASDAELEAARAQVAVLIERVEELERRLGKDSSNSSKPPSSDSPHTKKSPDRSLRGPVRAPARQAARRAVVHAEAVR
jgi:uncharacterized coiled-coil protein SlyX